LAWRWGPAGGSGSPPQHQANPGRAVAGVIG
jgi:hypothetical protein